MGMVYEKCMEVKYSGITHIGLNSLSLSLTHFQQMFYPVTATHSPKHSHTNLLASLMAITQ